ncbi:CDP-6-deoxy-delta-3,4-glucoseen reductase [Candidatus Symbiobacter mobilis]|uniref:CDP-4-dehydro-6-deoxyglucose reductase n=1 Tax=Candidatus Symbiobacter mobilis CR TaxID=946483 RepID=U5N8U6_9BURK|nr:CDP-6-deoxy-delta-3,4-glucoseen reductase [Candidatus Symbiobacter mobilis]AGX86683.1 CDP-4-dehydro-6-deoxyglucose reductase [Candidatus Symbiobacter mobilis CR]
MPSSPLTTCHVTVEPSHAVFTVQSGETILQAGLRQNVQLPYGCQRGVCGVCKVQKTAGTVLHLEHSPGVLRPEEEAQGMVLTCCATVVDSDVVLQSRVTHGPTVSISRKFPVQVISFEKVSHDVAILQLRLSASDQLDYEAGQYVDVLLPNAVRRSYSMARAPHIAPGLLEWHIRHFPAGHFSNHVFQNLRVGDVLRIEGPHGTFRLQQDSDKPIILLASGTGLAPIGALLEQLQHLGSRRDIALYWGGYRPSDFYRDAWIRAKQAEMPTLHYVPVVSNARPEDGWTGRTGYVHQAVLDDFADLRGHQVYACGAPVVVDAARQSYAQRGLPAEEFFADAFVSQVDRKTEN